LVDVIVAAPVARGGGEAAVAHHLRENTARSFKFCNDASRLTYRFSKRNSVSVIRCLQVAPPKGDVLGVASNLGAGDADAAVGGTIMIGCAVWVRS
jgi:hypothetical protein